MTINSTSPRELIDTELDAVVGGATGGNSFFGAGGSALALNVAGPQTNQTNIGG